jgi:hypothetical protein
MVLDERDLRAARMTPPAHLLVSWIVANFRRWERADLAAVVVAGIAPDIDGIGYPVEWLTAGTDHELTWYTSCHHVVAHGLLGALVYTGLVGWWRRKWWVALASFVIYHLHLLCDLAGSGGPDGEIWPILYLWPVSSRETSVAWQWPLDSPINVVFTLTCEVAMVIVAYFRGFSPLSLISVRADQYVFGLVRRLRRERSGLGNPP